MFIFAEYIVHELTASVFNEQGTFEIQMKKKN